MNSSVDFAAIAIPLVERGFRVTPVHPETKRGVLLNWQNHQLTSKAEVETFIQKNPKYAHHCVGVVGKRGVGRHCFLDIDADGVAARIESETGKKLPLTFTVQSRPLTAKFKQHHYYTQTEHSFAAFGKLAANHDPWKSKNINIRDLTQLVLSRKGHLIHPVLFDVKGTGGGSLVVGPGSIRAGEDHEVYTILHDVAVVPIPNWLTDWIIRDFRRYVDGTNKESAAKLAAKVAERAKFTPTERAEMRKKNLPEGFDIYEEDIFPFMRWRAGQLHGLGTRPDAIETVLAELVEDTCVGGVAFVSGQAGRDVIHKIAHSVTLKPGGDASWFYKRMERIVSSSSLSAKSEGTVVSPTALSRRRTIMVEVIEQMLKRSPDGTPSGDAYSLLKSALAKEGFPFGKSHADQQAALEARTKAKCETKNVNGKWLWLPV